MILLKYTKTDGAEFLSHLDVLRHLMRTFRRAGIEVAYSQGYNPHMLVYMSAPIGVGVKSLSEYCVVETEEDPTAFKEKFNLFSPRGIKCTGAWYTPKKVGVASDIVKAEYFVTGIADFDPEEVLRGEEFIITDKNGKEKNVAHLIYGIEKKDGGYKCVLGFGNGLRIEKFTQKLVDRYGGKDVEAIKVKGLLQDGRQFEEILR